MKKQRSRPMLAALLILGLLLCGCQPSSPTPTPFPTLRPTPTPVALPEFLLFVFPTPGSTIGGLSLAQHNWATLYLPAIAETGETLTPQDLQERTWLLVDDSPLEFELTADYGGTEIAPRVWASFSPNPGEHQATIRVRQGSGELLEFSWRFSVGGEDAFVLPGLPEGFQFVRPLPDSTISRQEYRGGDSVPAEYVPGFAILDGGVCYGILGSKVVEPGEILEAEEVGKKAHFVTLDGMPPGPEAHIRGGADLGLYEVYDATGQVITSYGGKQHYECWRADLGPGRHEATVRIERASGQVTEFTWWFVVTED